MAMYIILGVVRIYNFYRLNVFYQINSIVFLDKFIILIVFISLGGMPPMLGFLKIIINNSLRIILIFTIVISSLTLLYFYLSRIYFYLTNIPSLKINFKLTPFLIKKIIYIISLLFINLAFSIYIQKK